MSGNRNVCLRKFKFYRIFRPGNTKKFFCTHAACPLPPAFTKYSVQESSTGAILLSPLGKSGLVEVRKDGKCFTLTDGWQKFVVDHRLNIGDLLVIKHKDALIFDVTIFDPTGRERIYDPIAASGLTKDEIPREEDNFPKMEDKSERASGWCIRKRNSLHGKGAAEANKEHQPIVVEEYASPRRDRKPSTAMDHHRRGPHQFKVVMKKHHCRKFLELPAGFGSSNGLSGIRQFSLRDPKGQLWPCRLCHSNRGHHIRSHIGSGWHAFCAGNNLNEGDSCVFELNGKAELLVQIHRRRGIEFKENVSPGTIGTGKEPLCMQSEAELAAKPVVPSRSGQTMKRVKRVRDQKTPEPIDTCTAGSQFMCTVCPSSLWQDRLYIPRTFLWLVDPPALAQIILVDPKSRRWPVRVGHWRQGTIDRVCLRCGWRAFCMDNNVQVGVACVFKLGTSEGNHIFHVQVVKSLGTVAQ